MSELAQQVEEKAALAVAQFQDRAGGALDLTPDSLAIIEEMLAEAAEFADQIGPEQIETICELMGSYLLQVGYTEHGGTYCWSDESDQPVLMTGEPRYRVALMTFDKIRGRLSGDAADNIPFFYQGFSDRVRTARDGEDVLFA